MTGIFILALIGIFITKKGKQMTIIIIVSMHNNMHTVEIILTLTQDQLG